VERQNLIWAWHDEQGTGYALSSGVMHRLDYASGAWSQASTPESARLLAYRRTQGGTIGILTSPGGSMGGVFAGVYYSRDEGKSWAGVQAPFNVKVSPVLQLKDGRMVMPGGVFSKTELQISSDDGKSWSHQGDYELGRTLVPLSTGDALDMDSGQHGLFTIRSSVDAGKTWRVEYSNFDKEAYDAQQKKNKQARLQAATMAMLQCTVEVRLEVSTSLSAIVVPAGPDRSGPAGRRRFGRLSIGRVSGLA
jgi:hypothetical protein